MTWQDYVDLNRYWSKNPPSHKLLAWQIGYEPPADAPKDREKSMDAFLASIGRHDLR